MEREYGGIFAGLYRRYVREFIKKEINRQRIKLIYDIWWYSPLVRFRGMKWTERWKLIWHIVRVDWFILTASKPAEIVPVLLDLMSRRARSNEVFLEAGCWNGGSTAKFSMACKRYGYGLHVFDSFLGVKEWGYAYGTEETVVRNNIAKYGIPEICFFHSGWFKDTLRERPPAFPIRMAYIDCDVPTGTLEVLSGILPALVEDAVIYTQDYHLPEVRSLLQNEKTWTDLGTKTPTIEPVIRNLARITWPNNDRQSNRPVQPCC